MDANRRLWEGRMFRNQEGIIQKSICCLDHFAIIGVYPLSCDQPHLICQPQPHRQKFLARGLFGGEGGLLPPWWEMISTLSPLLPVAADQQQRGGESPSPFAASLWLCSSRTAKGEESSGNPRSLCPLLLDCCCCSAKQTTMAVLHRAGMLGQQERRGRVEI